MSDNDSKNLVNVGDLAGLSKPTSTLIDKVASATRILYEPIRITRKAKADGKAAIIIAEAQSDRGTPECVRRHAERPARLCAAVKKLPHPQSDRTLLPAAEKTPTQRNPQPPPRFGDGVIFLMRRATKYK